MIHSRDSRVVKPSNQNGGIGKRRAPYAMRACDACRRRKGKCDGRQPCRHCAGRGQSCSYLTSSEPDDSQSESMSVVDNVNTCQSSKPPTHEPRRANSSGSGNGDAILEMLTSLQKQLNSLSSEVHMFKGDQPGSVSSKTMAQGADPRDLVTTISGDYMSGPDAPNPIQKTSRKSASKSFLGPTSPDYALKVAQLRVRQNSHSGPPLQGNHLQLASIDEEEDSDGGDVDNTQDIQASLLSMSPRSVDRDDTALLLSFRSLMALQEVIRLLYVYQEVVGDLHPVVDMDALIMQSRFWYADANSGVSHIMSTTSRRPSYDMLLILNLALTIALRAESTTTNCNTEALLRESSQNAINAKLASAAHSVDHVTIIFLKGWYEFFRDRLRSAWRMVGLAGRALMELGFHNGDVSNHTLDTEARRSDVYTLMSSVVVVDRQWSSATGLPTHFHDSSFPSLSTSSVKNKYLRAMLSFILISDRFAEPMAKAAKGEKHHDDEAFELMNFQIDQWRKKAVGDYSLAGAQTWHIDPSNRPPAWAILLNLRAQSVRTLLFKPVFLSDLDTETTKTHIRPATELIFNTVNVLYTLDTTSDIYRKQHPYFQHILANASGLAFLLIAFIESNKPTLLNSLTTDVVDSLSSSFEMAVSLTTRYCQRSRSARRLSKGLSEMRGILVSLGILGNSSAGDATSGLEQEPVANNARPGQKASFAQPVPHGLEPCPDHSLPFDKTRNASDTDVQIGWADALRLQWPLGDVDHMFSECIF